MLHFDLLFPEGCEPGTPWSAVDVLRQLNVLARIRSPRAVVPAVSWRLIDGSGRTHRWHAQTCADASERGYPRKAQPAMRILLVPPLQMASIPALVRLLRRNAKSVALIHRRFETGALIGACGTGVWLLAQAGCIARAPLPWLHQSGFEAHFPAIEIEAREPIVAQPGSVCAVAPQMLHALVLHLVHAAGLADLTHAAAEKLLLNAERQALAAAMTPEQIMGQSRDSPLFRAQSWIQAHAAQPVRLADMATAAAVSERTLSRLFRQHLGQSPLAYVQALRIQRARMWLESTWRSVDEIAQDCGYRDTSAFCRMFARETGISPRRYRERYTFRGPRANWKLQTQGDLDR